MGGVRYDRNHIGKLDAFLILGIKHELTDLVTRGQSVSPNQFQQCRAAGGDVDASMRRYVADVYSLDQDIGRLLTKIDE